MRAKSRDKSLDQLKDLITAEYGARGIEIAPSEVDFNAEMLQVEQQPFGRARTALKAIRTLKYSGEGMIRLIKLDAAAHDWLERVRTEARRRIGSGS